MRILALAALAAVTVLTLTGCAAVDRIVGDDDSDEGSSSDGSGSTDPVRGGSYPQTIDTAFGDVRITERPQRIVALGWGDAETVLALGYEPVGASDWLGFGGDGVGPWAEGLYTASPEIIDTLEPDYEQIAELDPDLILDVKGSGDQERYDRLSSIATTVGIPDDGANYLTDMEDQVEMIAEALGVPQLGEQLLDEVESAYDDVEAAHPEWNDRTVTAATKTSEGWGAYIEGGGRVETLEEFGFEQNPAIAALPVGSTGFSVQISSEELDVIDADVIVAFPIFLETSAITDDPQWQNIPAVQQGRAVVIDGDISAAYSIGTTLSSLYTIENLVPLLEEALPAG